MKSKIEYILKHNLVIQNIYKKVMSFVFRFLGYFFSIDENIILFNSFGGRKFNDSPKVIFDYLSEKREFDNFKFVWAFENPEKYNIPKATLVKIDSWKYFKTALKAKYWISSVNIERGLNFKKNETIYLNTWHGAGTKKIGNAVSGRKDFNFSNVDFMLVQSEYEKEIFRKDFLVRDESFLLSGFPRSDELFQATNEKVLRYRKVLGIPDDKKVILYAPTWRDSVNGGMSYDIKPPIKIEKWKEQLSNEYVVLFRTHAFTTNVLNMEFNEFVRDASSYVDLNHLLIVADIVITDYSTLVFDYSILEKPFLCFGYDYDEYKKERGFYLDIEKEYPNGVFKTEDEVLDFIKDIDYNKEIIKVKSFKKKYIEAGGRATEIAIENMFNVSLYL
ncbi:MAG: CDP-glycerol glycerophosphotransferase family protein [Salinivirgaceae bacterium]